MNLLTSSIANNSTLTLIGALTAIGTAFILGGVVSFVYGKINRSVSKSSYQFTLLLLPTLIAMLIYLINNNVATAFSLAGAFSLIRFRSESGNPTDIVYIFFAVVIGLACGLGYWAYGALFTLLICSATYLLSKTNNKNNLYLKILVPEDLDFENVFDDILKKYTINYELLEVKTREFGSLFELQYHILLKNTKYKDLLNDIRIKNSNLNIKITKTLN